jgi:hypothetical protein
MPVRIENVLRQPSQFDDFRSEYAENCGCGGAFPDARPGVRKGDTANVNAVELIEPLLLPSLRPVPFKKTADSQRVGLLEPKARGR